MRLVVNKNESAILGRNYITKTEIRIKGHIFKTINLHIYAEMQHWINETNMFYFGPLQDMKKRMLSRYVEVP